jgi:phosphatidylglycerol:prolipoprotein diacylglycerol transferase
MLNEIINWNVDSVIFWITDSFPLKYYGLLFVSGLILGYHIVKRIYGRENVPIEDLDKILIYIIVGTVLGARLGHCLFYEPDYFFKNPIEILLPIKKIGDTYQFVGFRGLASHGGTIGVLIAIIMYCKKYKVNLLWQLDRIAIAVPVSAAFIRFGNFMNSEIYGKPTDGSWGVVFMKDDLIPRHPTQLYEAFSYLLIFAVLHFLYQSKISQKDNGLIFGCFLVLLFMARFCIEYFKENQESFENQLPINMGQLLSVPFIVAGLILIVWKLNAMKKLYIS